MMVEYMYRRCCCIVPDSMMCFLDVWTTFAGSNMVSPVLPEHPNLQRNANGISTASTLKTPGLHKLNYAPNQLHESSGKHAPKSLRLLGRIGMMPSVFFLLGLSPCFIAALSSGPPHPPPQPGSCICRGSLEFPVFNCDAVRYLSLSLSPSVSLAPRRCSG